MSKHYPAAFINAIAEEGTKDEAVHYLQETWDELCALQDIRVHPQHKVWEVLTKHFPDKADFIVSLVAPYLAEPSPHKTTPHTPDNESEPA